MTTASKPAEKPATAKAASDTKSPDTTGSSKGRLIGLGLAALFGLAVVVGIVMALTGGSSSDGADDEAASGSGASVTTTTVVRRTASVPSPQGVLEMSETIDIGRLVVADHVFPLYPPTLGEVVLDWTPSSGDDADDATAADADADPDSEEAEADSEQGRDAEDDGAEDDGEDDGPADETAESSSDAGGDVADDDEAAGDESATGIVPDLTGAVDILAPEGTPFVAPASGVIHMINPTDKWDPTTDLAINRDGVSILIRGEDGFWYYGGYLSAVAEGIEPGLAVRAGTTLGYVGNSGQAVDGPTRLRFAVSRKAGGPDYEPFPLLTAWAGGYATASPADGPRAQPIARSKITGVLSGGGEAELSVPAGTDVAAPVGGEIVDVRLQDTWISQEVVTVEGQPEMVAQAVLDADGGSILDDAGSPVTTMVPTGKTLPPVTIQPEPNQPGAELGLLVTMVGDDGFRYRFSRLGTLGRGVRSGQRIEAGQRLGSAGSSGDANGTAGRVHIQIRGTDTSAAANPNVVAGESLDATGVAKVWRAGFYVAPDVALGLRNRDLFPTRVVPAQPLSEVSFNPGGHSYAATDLFAVTGTEAVAPVDGVIGAMSWSDFYDPVSETGGKGGLYMYLYGDDGYRYYGSHYDTFEPGLEPGVRVSRGQRIGTVGRTGNAQRTPPHIHFEISRIDDVSSYRGQIDPTTVLEAWRNGDDDVLPEG